jgi:hypothetical protein
MKFEMLQCRNSNVLLKQQSFNTGDYVNAILSKQRAETISNVLYPDDRTYQVHVPLKPQSLENVAWQYMLLFVSTNCAYVELGQMIPAIQLSFKSFPSAMDGCKWLTAQVVHTCAGEGITSQAAVFFCVRFTSGHHAPVQGSPFHFRQLC